MTDAIVHRGPDARGYFRDEHAALFSRRLSIIDLANGNQPISNETGDAHLVCNGEIYNSPELRRQLIAAGHRFKTATDVEVILHLYEEHGKDCARYLRGMFAFALWDQKSRTLLLARDHLGQKPLFFYQDHERFLFGSEIKAIRASGLVEPQIDLEGLWHYVSMRFLPDRYTLFKGIRKLPAGTLLCFRDGACHMERYWDVDFTRKIGIGEAEIVEELDGLLKETIGMHLLSDVRVGAFLSGGIDSSLVSAVMATINQDTQPVPAFSVGVEEHSFNELPFARMVASRYGLEAHEQVVEADLIHLLPTMVHHMDEPADPYGAGVWFVSRLARESVKVVLTGDGGDENFAGYDRFVGQRLLDYYCLLPAWFRQQIAQRLIDRLPESYGYKSLAQKARWFNEMSFFSGAERYAQSMGVLRFTQEAKRSLFTRTAQDSIEDYDSIRKIVDLFESENVDHVVDRMLYSDLMTRMPDHLLVTVDRMSMAHSLETRSPLIDHKVVDYAASVPGELKLKGNQLKYLLRKVAGRYLPEELIHRQKQGLGFPLGIWMRTELRQFMQNLFAESRMVDLGIFDGGYTRRLLDEHLSGRRDHNYRLWLLINLEIWYQMSFEGRSVAAMGVEIERLLGGRNGQMRLDAAE